MTSKRGLRLGVCGVVLGTVYLGITASAMASNQPLWVRQFGTYLDDIAFGVATDVAGNVYLSGRTEGSLGGPHRGGYDAWVVKYDPAGGVVWKRQLGTADNDGAYGVATDAAGNVYLTGNARGSLGGPHRGDYDAWVVKYDPAGRKVWKRQLGTETSDSAYDVATDAAGNIYLTGYTYGSLGGGPTAGGFDAWLAKYSTRR